MSEHPVTTRGVGGVLRLDGKQDLPVIVLLRHSGGDPSVLRAVLVLDADASLELALDRGLLTRGLSRPSHDGQAHVAVVGGEVRVTIAGLTLGLPLPDVIDMLLASYQAAPTGSDRDSVTETAHQLSQA